MPLFWDLIDSHAKIDLIKFQWENHGTKLDLFNQSMQPEVDHIPEEENLGKFMSQAPHSPIKVN